MLDATTSKMAYTHVCIVDIKMMTNVGDLDSDTDEPILRA